ncbi:MAG: TonB-dependent receptor plug domain-containing protein, partial [Proteobacteria bacterium]|nr:TonB-dependent receptor plug domain-containing protein [Pseudomonadota bacterium]
MTDVRPATRRLRFSTVPSLRQAAGTTLLATSLASTVHAQTAPATTPAEPVQIPTVSVQGGGQGNAGYQVQLPTLPKLMEPLLDTPQSINVIPRELMNDQGVSTVADALRNVPGISLAAGEAGNQGNNLTIRGFSARNDFYLDGMRDFGSYYRDPF